MFAKSQTQAEIEAKILSALSKLETLEPDSKEYAAIVDQVTKLHKLKTDERPKPISKDTMLIVAANVFGILWIARYERENVIKSRNALSFVMKPRQ